MQKVTSPSFELHDSSISRVEIEHAVSRSLLGSSAVVGRNLLNHVKTRTGLSASTLTFAGSYNLLTNPLTYPQYQDKEHWFESLTQKGYNPTVVIRVQDDDFGYLDILPNYRMNQSANELAFSTFRYFEKIGSTDVSLNEYDSITDLRAKFNLGKGVSSFLLKNSVLISFLKGAYDELAIRFPSSEFGLEIKVDPEVDNWSTLFLYITPLWKNDLIESKTEEFIMDWMFKQNPEVRKLVTIVDRIL